jgi:hypothetical protein
VLTLKRIIVLLTLLIAATFVPFAEAKDYYVSASGNGYGKGSQKSPWDFARADKVAKAGDVIHVTPGTYTFHPTLKLTAVGLPNARVRFVSDTKGGAHIVSSGATDAWDSVVAITGDYVDFEGFDVSATNTTALNWGIFLAGKHQHAIGNTVHDIPAPGPVSVGGAGIASSLANSRNRVWGTDNQAISNTIYNIGNYRNPNHNPRVHGLYWSNRDGYVANNVIHHVMSWGIKFGHAADHGTIVNNLVFSNGYGGIVIGTSTEDNGGDRPDSMYVANNIVYHNGIGSGAQGFGIQEFTDQANLGPNCTYTNNLVNDNKPDNWNLKVTKGSGINTVSAAPKFRNWREDGTGDYRPAPGSPAIDGGIAVPAPGTAKPAKGKMAMSDRSGASRPKGKGYDIGPYEYQEEIAANQKRDRSDVTVDTGGKKKP